MSLTQTVTDMIRDGGPATSNDLHSRLVAQGKSLTLDQVRAALENAKYRKLLAIKRGPARGGVGGGSLPGVYSYIPQEIPQAKTRKPRPRQVERRPPTPSVWNLATGIDMPWPPKFDGGRQFAKLGPWDDSKAA